MNMTYVTKLFVPFLLVLININAGERIISDPIIRKGSSLKDFCNKSVEIYEDISSPKLTIENYGKSLTCWYKFRSFRGNSLQEWILRVRFKKFKFGVLINSTDCEGGYMQIIDGNAKTNLSNRKDQGIFCGEIEQMQTFISETSFVKVLFHTDNFTDQTYYSFDTRAEQEYNLYHRFGKHPELYPNRRGHIVPGTYCERVFKDCRLQTCYVQSPAYPGIYPRGMHCVYHLNTKLPFIKLYIENEDFNVDGQRCENIISCPMRQISTGIQSCPNDYIRIYDGKNTSAKEIGTFCGMGKFPYSIIGTSQDLFVEFFTSRAGPLLNTGFHFNVGSWPGRMETAGVRNGFCNWIMTEHDLKSPVSSEGIFLSLVHWYPPYTSCTYLIQGPKDHIVRIYFPSLRINKIQSPIVSYAGDCGESLTIYDSSWPNDSKIIKTFCDTFSKAIEKYDFVSTGPALFVQFESKTGSYSGSSLYYWAHYDFFNNTKFGTPIAGSTCDEEFLSWNQQHGWFRSPVNTLIYKKRDYSEGDMIKCRYKFFTDHRMYARIVLTIHSVAFKAHPFGLLCKTCWNDKVDRLVIWEEEAPSMVYNASVIRTKRKKKHESDDISNDTSSSSGSSNTMFTSSSGSNTMFTSSSGSNTMFTSSSLLSFVEDADDLSLPSKKITAKSECLCGGGGGNNTAASSNDSSSNLPLTVVSGTENLNLELMVDASHALANYFKYDTALFEASYKFVHEPICGPTILEYSYEGELQFPNYQTLGFVEAPRSVHCIWDIRVRKNRDISLHFDQIKFASKSCQDGKLEIYLPSTRRHRPFISVCGHNVSALSSRLVTSADLLLVPSPPAAVSGGTADETSSLAGGGDHQSASYAAGQSVQLQYIGLTVPTKTILKISWTELYHVPRNIVAAASKIEKLEMVDCHFVCSGDLFCVPTYVLCNKNGLVNCPRDYNQTQLINASTISHICPRIPTSYTKLSTFGMVLSVVCFAAVCSLLIRYAYLVCVSDPAAEA